MIEPCRVCGHPRKWHRLLHSTLSGAVLCRWQTGSGPCLCAYYDMRARVAP